MARSAAQNHDRKTPDPDTPEYIAALKPAVQRAFLLAFRECGVVTHAARAARIDRPTVYLWRKNSPEFDEAFAVALEEATDALERAAVDRAVVGLVRKKFTKDGVPIIDPATGDQYVEREFSDKLLEMLLKARRPQTYGRSLVEHSGPDGKAIQIETAVSAAIMHDPELHAAAARIAASIEAGRKPAEME